MNKIGDYENDEENYKEAIDKLKEVLRLEPDNKIAQFLMNAILTKLSKGDVNYKMLERSTTLKSKIIKIKK